MGCRDNECCDRHCKCHKPKCKTCCPDHHHYHHDQHGHAGTHPGAFKSIASLSAELISPFDLSKEPGKNAAVGGIMIGACAPASNLWPAIQATLSHIACLAELVGASDAPQFKDVYAFRKYEGDAPCVLVLSPTPCVYVPSSISPAPAESLPGVVRDCEGRAWTTITNAHGCGDPVDDPETGKTTYTFAATYGDGTPAPDAKPFSFSIPTIKGIPDCPEKTGPDDTTEYHLSCSACVNDGAPEWVEVVADTTILDIGTPVAGAVFVADGAGGGVWLPKGEVGQVLTCTAAGTVWGDAPSGGDGFTLPACPDDLTNPMLTCSGETVSWVEAPTGGTGGTTLTRADIVAMLCGDDGEVFGTNEEGYILGCTNDGTDIKRNALNTTFSQSN